MFKKNIRVLCSILIFMAFFLGYLGIITPQFTNEHEYQEAYQNIIPYENITEANKKFTELQKTYLTKKFIYIDYSATTLLIAVILLAATFFEKIKSPNSKFTFVLISFLCGISFLIADLAQTSLELNRGLYPHWADSFGAAIVMIISFAMVVQLYLLLHLYFLRSPFLLNQTLKDISFKDQLWVSLNCGFIAFF
ncbi:MAG: hypothetical protein HUU56_10255 [Bdellovibrionaceae bacterium]|nr:hypothetical protein [Pseudobdellovibrionaceae bacterium]